MTGRGKRSNDDRVKDMEAVLQAKWGPLLHGVEGPHKEIVGKLLENEVKHLDDIQKKGTKIGNFEKFAFPLIRRAWSGGLTEEESKTPLQELTERAFAEHDPTDDDWQAWVAEVEAAYELASQDPLQGPPEALEKEWQRIQRIEHPERFRPKRGGGFPSLIAQDIVSVQPMTQPVGGIAFYRPKYGKKEEGDEAGT